MPVHCGLREEELLTLRSEDAGLDAPKPALLVRRTLTRGDDGRGWVVGTSTKSGKGRRVRLIQRAVAALKDHRKRQLEERMRLAGLWQDQGLMFTNEAGSLLNPSNLRNRSFKRNKADSRTYLLGWQVALLAHPRTVRRLSAMRQICVPLRILRRALLPYPSPLQPARRKYDDRVGDRQGEPRRC